MGGAAAGHLTKKLLLSLEGTPTIGCIEMCLHLEQGGLVGSPLRHLQNMDI